MIVNVTADNFGGPMRNGDLIALCNLIQGLRNVNNSNNIQFHVPDSAIQPYDYVRIMRDWIIDNTDYLTRTPGTESISKNQVNLWDQRCMYGDVVQFDSKLEQKQKIVIVPVLDAGYNTYRNWSDQMLHHICKYYSGHIFNNYEKLVLTHLNTPVDLCGFKQSSDFSENLVHIQECAMYVGGDTGLSHFMSAFVNSPEAGINYFYGAHGLLHTNPFYSGMGIGNMNQFIGTNYNLKNL